MVALVGFTTVLVQEAFPTPDNSFERVERWAVGGLGQQPWLGVAHEPTNTRVRIYPPQQVDVIGAQPARPPRVANIGEFVTHAHGLTSRGSGRVREFGHVPHSGLGRSMAVVAMSPSTRDHAHQIGLTSIDHMPKLLE